MTTRSERILGRRRGILGKSAQDVIEARLDDVSDACVVTAVQLDRLCMALLPESFPPPPLPAGHRLLTARMLDALSEILDAVRSRPDCRLSADEWVIVAHTILPERYRDPPCFCGAGGGLLVCPTHGPQSRVRTVRLHRPSQQEEDCGLISNLLRMSSATDEASLESSRPYDPADRPKRGDACYESSARVVKCHARDPE